MDSCNNKKSCSKNSKKVAFALVMFTFVIACCFYFLYWIRTPQYSLYEAYDAVKTHDVDKFKRYVDLDSVLGTAYDDYVEETLSGDKSFGGQLAFGMAAALKDHIVRMGKNEIYAKIEAGSYPKGNDSANAGPEGNTGSAESEKNSALNSAETSSAGRSSDSNEGMFNNNPMLKGREAEVKSAAKWKYKGVKNVKKEGKIAYATLKFYDRELDKNYNMIVRMREKNDGQWQVIAFDNLMELLKEIGKEKLAGQ